MAAFSPLTLSQINEVLCSCGLECDSTLLGRVETYLRFLAKWNAQMNLTAIQAPLEMLKILLAESFFAAEVVGDPRGPILDIGSGAGIPGLALAVYHPELDVILLEPRKKRAAFLTALRRQLGLTRVAVWNRRLEECDASCFPELPTLLTMRAVGDVKRVVERGIGLLRGSRQVLLFSSLQAAKASIEGIRGICWRRPSIVPWNPEHVLILGQVDEMFHVKH